MIRFHFFPPAWYNMAYAGAGHAVSDNKAAETKYTSAEQEEVQ